MRLTLSRPTLAALVLGALPAAALDLGDTVLGNPTAYIPPQCYTKTLDAGGQAHNPCQTCHVRSRAPHYGNDQDLQTEYSFPGPALTNPWTNLFVDRSAAVAAVAPEEILSYVRQDNYRDAEGRVILAERLDPPPADWDVNGDGRWNGYVPDAGFAFDDEGFDHTPDGAMTGWRAFAYQPLPGTFWPTNGSTDDVLIRLPAAYREATDGTPDRAIYKLNLATVEALIKRADVAIERTDEAALGVDLDRDGKLGTATRIAFHWAPKEGRDMAWLGLAGSLPRSQTPLAAGLYPLGTEFLHSVRYLDPTGDGIAMAPRIKELRYMRKTRWLSYFDRMDGALAEAKERHDFPDRIALFFGDAEAGITNGTGWRLQGFIEDAAGDLRPQSFEETVFCMGCHGGVGATGDDTFAFPRKLGADQFQGGWYHWTQSGLYGVPDLLRADGRGEYAHYLRSNGAGDEFRGNAELINAWLDAQGELTPEAAQGFAHDIGQLLYPSKERALDLNAAYREIVREQSFVKGRDATIVPQTNVWRAVEQGQPTGIDVPETPWYRR